MEKQIVTAARHQTAAFFSLVHHPLKFRLYLLKNLPAAFFSGVTVVRASEETCVTAVPYRWLTQNPFRSTYFASLSMAAELSTGLLAMAQVYGRRPSVSMLVTGMEAQFYKKAKGITIFTCGDGAQISDAVTKSLETGQAHEIKAQSIGRNSSGEEVAAFWFRWSFKPR